LFQKDPPEGRDATGVAVEFFTGPHKAFKGSRFED